MKPQNRIGLLYLLLAAAISSAIVSSANATPSPRGSAALAGGDRAEDALAKAARPLAPYQARLLDIAFESVSAMPLRPHVKNRSRAQERVIDACLELDQPQRASSYADRIANWRRGSAHASLALYLVENAQQEVARELIQAHLATATESADEILRKIDDPDDESIDSAQDWQRDHIRTKVAEAHARMGDHELAAKLEAGAIDSEAGRLTALAVETADAASFESTLETIGFGVVEGNLDQERVALINYARLFDRFFANEDQRSLVEKRIRDTWSKTPRMVRVDVLVLLTESALSHGDPERALSTIQEAQDFVAEAPWSPEENLAYRARLAALRHRAGDPKEARREIDSTLGRFDSLQGLIVDIYRAEALRNIAESYLRMGDPRTAQLIYKRAIEAGTVNPNGRPRAEDLAATCCSLAVAGLEPDAELWARIEKAQNELGAPW